MSTSIMALCWPLQMPPVAKAVLVSLADNANDAGHCWPAIETICERTCFKRRAVIEAIHWLEEAGHLTADRSNGRKTTYQLHPNQCTTRTSAPKAPVRQTHDTSAPGARDQCTTRTQPVRQTHTNRQEPSLTVKEPSTRVTREAVSLPDWIDGKTWERWRAHRKALRKPMTADAERLALRTLERLRSDGNDPLAVIEKSIESGWQGLFAVERPPARASPPPRRSAATESGLALAGLSRQTDHEVIDVESRTVARSLG